MHNVSMKEGIHLGLSKERVGYVDLYRGIGIILMIMAHIGFGSLFDHYIHAFHMPMFFFVSGYFFKSRPPGEFFKQKILNLLIPYCVYGTIIYFCWKVLFQTSEESLSYTLLYMNSSRFVAAALWFLTALFVANVIYWLLYTAFQANIYIYIYIYISVAAIILSLCGNYLRDILENPCVFACDAGFVGVGIMHCGYICRHSKSKLVKKVMALNWIEVFLGFIAISVLILANGKINMREGRYGFVPLFWVNAIGMCIIIWNASRKIVESIQTSQSGVGIGKLCMIVMGIGRRSMTYLCFNQIIISIAFKVFPIAENANGLLVLVHNLLVLLIVLILLYPVAIFREKVVKNNKLWLKKM